MKNDIHNLVINSAELVQIDVKNLQVGMFVSQLDRPWLETDFLFQGFELKSQADIEAVQKQCDFVFIDRTKQTRILKYVSRSTAYSPDYLQKAQPPEKHSTFAREIKNAEYVHRENSRLVKNFMQEVQLGRPIDVVAAKEAVANCVDSVLNAPEALMLMTQLKKRDEYTAQHSVNVCIYAIALGRQLGFSVAELNNIGLCGMMHDMGKMLVPLEILNKPGRLMPDELAIMQSHAVRGRDVLLKSSGMYPGAIDVAYMHHERLDGAGYPRKLQAEQITPYAKIVAIVDMYDAVSSDRVYHDGRSHLDTIKILTDASGAHLDSGLTVKFIECLGIYPAGSIVELGSGEVALVLEVNPKAKLKPKILILQDRLNHPCSEFVLDLAMTDANSPDRNRTIKKILRPEECGINLLDYYQSGLFQRSMLDAEAKTV